MIYLKDISTWDTLWRERSFSSNATSWIDFCTENFGTNHLSSLKFGTHAHIYSLNELFDLIGCNFFHDLTWERIIRWWWHLALVYFCVTPIEFALRLIPLVSDLQTDDICFSFIFIALIDLFIVINCFSPFINLYFIIYFLFNVSLIILWL